MNVESIDTLLKHYKRLRDIKSTEVDKYLEELETEIVQQVKYQLMCISGISELFGTEKILAALDMTKNLVQEIAKSTEKP